MRTGQRTRARVGRGIFGDSKMSKPHVDMTPEMQAAMQKCMDLGDVPARSDCGQQFQRWLFLDKAMQEKYGHFKGAGSAAKKREMRMDWLNMKLNGETEISKSKTRQLYEEHGEEGRYMAFDKMCVAEVFLFLFF